MKTNTERALEGIVKQLEKITKCIEKFEIDHEKKSKETDNINPTIESLNKLLRDACDLAADMTIRNATQDEMKRILSFSKAVIDARHEYKIDELWEKYGYRRCRTVITWDEYKQAANYIKEQTGMEQVDPKEVVKTAVMLRQDWQMADLAKAASEGMKPEDFCDPLSQAGKEKTMQEAVDEVYNLIFKNED